MGRLRTRILVIVTLGAALVGGGVGLLLANAISLRSSADATVRSDRYLLAVAGVERLVVDAETGLRGYLITDRGLFLAPLYAARAELPDAYRALAAAAAQNHAFGPQASSLIAAATSYMEGYVHAQLQLATRDLPSARSVAATAEGKRLVDGIRAQTAELEGLVARRQSGRVRAAHQLANRSILEGIVVLAMLTLLTALLGGYLGHLAVNRERARTESEAITRTLQESLLPAAPPRIPGCELAIRFVPARGPVGGDFYDVFEVVPGSWAIVIGDVCGKGAQAAAVTAMARWTLRSVLEGGARPDEALRSLNDAMLRQPGERRFITVACITLALGSDHAVVNIACGGHPAPIFVPAVGAAVAVPATGELIEVMADIRLRSSDLELRAGDSLVAYTDGVTDQGPDVALSADRALDRRIDHANAAQLADTLADLARSSAGRQRDDIAILALRYLPAADIGHATPSPAVQELAHER